MSAPAAISASLVNMRNVGTHKSVALTVHVPEELAAQVIEAFGWPTMASPVAVAIARLDPKAAGKAEEPKERKAWADLHPAAQAAIRAEEPKFQEFLTQHYWVKGDNTPVDTIRRVCGVSSRAELNENHKARVIWHQLDRAYQEATGRLAHG